MCALNILSCYNLFSRFIRNRKRVAVSFVLLYAIFVPIWSASAQQQECVNWTFDIPSVSNVPVGSIITTRLSLNATNIPFTAIGFRLEFEPSFIQSVDAAGNLVAEIEPGNLFSMPIRNQVSNTEGYIEFAQADMGASELVINETNTVATIHFRVIQDLPSEGTQIRFVGDDIGITGAFGEEGQRLCSSSLSPITFQPLAKQPESGTIYFYGSATLDTQPVPLGTVIRAYTSDDAVCGEFLVSQVGIYDLLACNVDGDNVLQPGDKILFTINGLRALEDFTLPDNIQDMDRFEVPLTASTIGEAPEIEVPLTASTIEEAPENELACYIVKWGDTTSSIARLYGVHIRDLGRVNNLSDLDHIHAGQLLFIPNTRCRDYYQVRRGDRLADIAFQYRTNTERLAQVNNIVDPNNIRIGQLLCIIDDRR